jgi:hypothetical protein
MLQLGHKHKGHRLTDCEKESSILILQIFKQLNFPDSKQKKLIDKIVK